MSQIVIQSGVKDKFRSKIQNPNPHFLSIGYSQMQQALVRYSLQLSSLAASHTPFAPTGLSHRSLSGRQHMEALQQHPEGHLPLTYLNHPQQQLKAVRTTPRPDTLSYLNHPQQQRKAVRTTPRPDTPAYLDNQQQRKAVRRGGNTEELRDPGALAAFGWLRGEPDRGEVKHG